MTEVDELTANFQKVASDIKQLFIEFKNKNKTFPQHYEEQLYGLFSQANKGDTTYASQPSLYQSLTDPFLRLKWNAWNKQKGKSQVQAKQEYIQLGTSILNEYNPQPPQPTCCSRK